MRSGPQEWEVDEDRADRGARALAPRVAALLVGVVVIAGLVASPSTRLDPGEDIGISTETSAEPAARSPELTFLGNPVRSNGGPIPTDRGYGVATIAGGQFAVPATDLDDPYPPVHYRCNGRPSTLRGVAGDVPFQALIAAAARSASIRGCQPELPEGLVTGGGRVDIWAVEFLGAMHDAGLTVIFEAPETARRARWLDLRVGGPGIADASGRPHLLRLDAEYRTRERLPVGFTTQSLAAGTAAVFPSESGGASLIFLCDPTTTVQTELPAPVIADLLDRIGCQPTAPVPPRVPCDDLVEGFPLADRERALRVIEATAESIPCQPGRP